jgi:hypothetical protein
MGVFSFALPSFFKAWMDGLPVAKLPVAYLQLDAGAHIVEILDTRQKTFAKRKAFAITLDAGKHLVMGVRRDRFGFRFQRDEEHRVYLRSYRPHQPPSQHLLSFGKHCIDPKTCLFLTPGEQLYQQADGRVFLMPSRLAQKNTRGRVARPEDGFLTLYSFPPGVLFLQDRVIAPTPLAKLPLAVGRYRAKILNGFMGLQWEKEIQILRGKTTREVAFLYPKQGGVLYIESQRPARVFVNNAFYGWTPLIQALPSGFHAVKILQTKQAPQERAIQIEKGQIKHLQF